MTNLLPPPKPKKSEDLAKKENKFEWHDEGIGTLVRVVILGWAGAILTLNYVSIPGLEQKQIDPTFIASVFTSGNNIKLDTAGGLGALTAGSAVGYTAADYSIVNAGESFSLTEAYTEGDATPTNLTIGSGVAAALPVLGSTTSFAGGVAGSLAGTIDSAGTLTLTAGGAGTQGLGQFTSEIQVQN